MDRRRRDHPAFGMRTWPAMEIEYCRGMLCDIGSCEDGVTQFAAIFEREGKGLFVL